MRIPKLGWAGLLGSVLVVAIAGCQSPQPASPTADRIDNQSEIQRLLFDVDPVRGAAFERPTAPGTTPLRMAVDAPRVTHDATTHKTKVAVQVTNAGAPLKALTVRVGDTTQSVSPAPQAPSLLTAGGSQVLEFEFDNPDAASFIFSLNFWGLPEPRTTI